MTTTPPSENNLTTTAEESFRLSEARLKEIEDQVKQTPLTSELFDLNELRSKYQQDAKNFLTGIDYLETKYESIRFVRGDGNCYYRAFLYSLAEQMLQAATSSTSSDRQENQRILNFVKNESFERVKKAGYQEMTISMFYEEFVELVEKAAAADISPADLHTLMNEENATSDYCTWYCRVITATHLRSDPDRFLPFIFETGLDIVQFCQREVEPMGKECEEIQVMALAEACGVRVQIEYLDGHDMTDGKLASHEFGPEDAKTKITMLYRPGHYDLLIKKKG